MGYRDNLTAIIARSNALERDLTDARAELTALRAELQRARAQTTAELTELAHSSLGDHPDVTIDDHILAEQVLARALNYDVQAHPWEEPPGPPPPPTRKMSKVDHIFGQGRELGREEGAIASLRYALHELMHNRMKSVPATMVARAKQCSDTAQLVEWIVAVGIASDQELATVLAQVGDSTD